MDRASAFTSNLIRLNGLDAAGFAEWVFYPGMLFGDSEIWWKGGRQRPRQHEGLDIAFFRTGTGLVRALVPGTRIPAIYDGVILKVDSDYLGRTIIVRHDIYDNGQKQLHTCYGHIVPDAATEGMHAVRAGQVFGAIAEVTAQPGKAPAHLHVSMVWAPPETTVDQLTWETLGNPEMFSLVDPLDAIARPYALVRVKGEG